MWPGYTSVSSGKPKQNIGYRVYHLPGIPRRKINPSVGAFKQCIACKQHLLRCYIIAAGAAGMARRMDHLKLISNQLEFLLILQKPVRF